MKEIGNLIDILAILPYYFSLVVEIAFMKISDAGESGEVRAFQIGGIFRIDCKRIDGPWRTGMVQVHEPLDHLKSQKSRQRYRKSCISCAASYYQNFASIQNSKTWTP